MITMLGSLFKGSKGFKSLLHLKISLPKFSLISRSLSKDGGIVENWEKLDQTNSFLEEVDGVAAIDWVKSRNEHSINVLGNPESTKLYARVLSILDSKDKIPYVEKIGDFYYNFWQDENNQRGILRRTTLLSFKSPEPLWQTVLDIDALGKAESISWVYKGYTLYSPDDEKNPLKHKLVLMELSVGGADATVIREFDLITCEFVPESEGGFVIPEAKSRVSWKDENTLLVGTDMTKMGIMDTLTNSGYPMTVFEWNRGTPLASAKKVFEGEKSDVAVTGMVVST